MSDFEGLTKRIRETSERFGRVSIDSLVEELAEHIRNAPELQTGPVTEALKTIRGVRAFDHLLRVTETLLEAGYSKPPTMVYRAQAMIENGCLDEAETLLREVLKGAIGGNLSSTHSEAAGLLGRLNKQRFVLEIEGNKELAGQHLRRAIEFHQGAYDFDRVWHGPNIIALAWRAKREGIKVEVKCEDFANKLVTSIEDDIAASGASAESWQKAALAQAYMALGQWDKAESLYDDYLKVASDAFTVNGDYRQLVEIWRIGPDDDEGAQILVKFANRALQLPNGYIVEDAVTLHRLAHRAMLMQQAQPQSVPSEQPQAVIDRAKLMPHEMLLELHRQSRFVCQIVHAKRDCLGQKTGGSGFLAHLGFFKNGASVPVVVTNAHVLSETSGPKAIGREEGLARFHNWKGSGDTAEFKIAEIIWSSPEQEHDICIARLEGTPDSLETAPIIDLPVAYETPNADPEQELGRAYTVGHPQGRGIEFGLETPQVLDHEFHTGLNGVRRLHYKTPTEPGSSGGPVFHGNDLAVVGVHRCYTENPIQGSPKPFHDRQYAANEAVGIHAVARKSREDLAQ